MTLPEGVSGHLLLPAKAYARDRTPWLAARRSGIGASETANILGKGTYRTPYDVWLDKVDPEPPVDGHPSEAAEWGSILEDAVARMVARRFPHFGRLLPSPGLMQDAVEPRMLATVDRLFAERKTKPTKVTSGLEIKTVSKWGFDNEWVDGPPLHILIQVQQQMAVLGLPYIWVAVLVAGQRMPSPYLIEADRGVHDMLREAIHHWWVLHVEQGVVPEPTYGDRERLTDIWPGDPDLPSVVADDDVRTALVQYNRARAARKHDDAVMQEHAFVIQKHLGPATELVDDEGNLLASWRPQTARRIDTALLRREYPDVVAAVERESTSRVFRAKEVDE